MLQEAEDAIRKMNGQWIGQKQVKCNWATRKTGDGTGATTTPRTSLFCLIIDVVFSLLDVLIELGEFMNKLIYGFYVQYFKVSH